jgi:hypothetical protein
MKVLEGLKLNLMHYSCDDCILDADQYQNGRLALMVLAKDPEEGFEEPVCTVTVNMPEAPCADNEIYVKDWTENAGMVEQLVVWGVIEDTILGSVVSGYVTVERYRLTAGFMVKLAEAALRRGH